MPRRSKKAAHEAQRRSLARLRYMFRHPQFHKDIALLRSKYPHHASDTHVITQEDIDECQRLEEEAKARHEEQLNNPSYTDLLDLFRRKWGLSLFPKEIFNLQGEADVPKNAQDYERGLLKYLARLKAEGEPASLPTSRAVFAEDPYITKEWYEYEAEYGGLPPEAPFQGTWLDIRVNLSYPKDVLESLISKELGKALAGRKRKQKQLLGKNSRLRTSTVAFELKVFDRCEAGQTFEDIAKELNVKTKSLKGRLSTVRSAYLAACRKIQAETGQPIQTAPSDSKHFYDTCPICSIASKTDQFCKIGKKQLLPA